MKKWKLRRKKRPVFGLSLKERMEYEEEELSNFTQVPLLVSNLITVIGEAEPVQGVFRVNGSERNIREIVDKLDQEKKIHLSKQPIFDLASLLKRYFRELPEPLLLCENYEELVRIGSLEGDEAKIPALTNMVKALPTVHKTTAKKLFYLLHHMSTISEYSMDDKNLAIVWGPNLIWPEQKEHAMANHTQLSVCITIMIRFYNELFGTVATPVVTNPMQSEYANVLQASMNEGDDESDNENDDEECLDRDIEETITRETNRLNSSFSLKSGTSQNSTLEPTPNSSQTPPDHSTELHMNQLERSSSIRKPVKLMEMKSVSEMLQDIEDEEELEEEVKPEPTKVQLMESKRPTIHTGRVPIEMLEMKRVLGNEIEQLKSKLLCNENSTVSQLQDLMERLDRLERFVQQNMQRPPHPDKEVAEHNNKGEGALTMQYKKHVTTMKQDITSLQDEVTQINEKVSRLVFVHEDLMKKMDDVLKEQKFSKVKSDYELEAMKRQIESQSTKLRDQGLELSTLKSKVDARLTYTNPLLKPSVSKDAAGRPITDDRRTSLTLSYGSSPSLLGVNNQTSPNTLNTLTARRSSISNLMYTSPPGSTKTTSTFSKPNNLSSSFLEGTARRKSLYKSNTSNFEQLKSKFQT